ncbi:GGDEF domain-containing protein [Methylophaga sp.]|uniref:GGDEF domain-containing protein n=1 Tax=Methylophaga sp. TaxID=2024840 RepID=UPI003F6A46AE
MVKNVLLICIIVFVAFAYHYKKLHSMNTKLHAKSITDPLTGIFNRLHVETELHNALQQLQRYQRNTGIIIIDIDHFKSINDKYGHNTGAQVLVTFAKILLENSRSTDMVCRWGGEEFLIICPGLDVSDSRTYADKLMSKVRESSYPITEPVTASMGVALLKPTQSVFDAVHEADKALYLAKASGRDQIFTAEDTASMASPNHKTEII